MSRWRRVYVDWRLFFIYPVVILLLGALGFSLTRIGAVLPVGQAVLLTVFVLSAVIWLWRTATEGIYCNDWGVRVQRLVRRTEIAWSDIISVCDVKSAGVIGFRTLDGRTIQSPVQWMGGMIGKSQSPMMRRSSYERLIARLNEEHARATGRTDSSGEYAPKSS